MKSSLQSSTALLTERLARQGTALTVCPLSNIKLCVFKTMKEHNLKTLLQHGLKVTINSDYIFPIVGIFFLILFKQCTAVCRPAPKMNDERYVKPITYFHYRKSRNSIVSIYGLYVML